MGITPTSKANVMATDPTEAKLAARTATFPRISALWSNRRQLLECDLLSKCAFRGFDSRLKVNDYIICSVCPG